MVAFIMMVLSYKRKQSCGLSQGPSRTLEASKRVRFGEYTEAIAHFSPPLHPFLCTHPSWTAPGTWGRRTPSGPAGGIAVCSPSPARDSGGCWVWHRLGRQLGRNPPKEKGQQCSHTQTIEVWPQATWQISEGLKHLRYRHYNEYNCK